MPCTTCGREHNPQSLPFLCPTDARNSIYPFRLQNIQLLLENEALQQEVATQLSTGRLETELPLTKDAINDLRARQRLTEDKTSQILAAADKLQEDIRAARDEIKTRKTALSERKTDIKVISDGLEQHRTKRFLDVENSVTRYSEAWASSATDMALTRRFLCHEAGQLYGLKKVEYREGHPGHPGDLDHPYEYHLGQIPVVDLLDMNSLSPELISTSLAHVSHLLMLTAHYLSTRLPAEITLPHRDYPQSTIYNLASSYHHGGISFSTTPALPATTTSSENQTHDSQHVPRPRPLFIDKPLPQLSKEDPATYAFFLEGVALLAYNIAWLCGTQGIPVGDKTTFEDVCDMGRNLYALLIPPFKPRGHGRKDDDDDDNIESGRFSHGSAFYNLSGVDGVNRIKEFKLPSPLKLADKLKKKLLGDAPDWEVVEDDEWKLEEETSGKANLGEASQKGNLKGSGKDVEKSSPRRESNGWMRVRNQLSPASRS